MSLTHKSHPTSQQLLADRVRALEGALRSEIKANAELSNQLQARGKKPGASTMPVTAA